MSDKPTAPAAGKRVAVISPDGQFGTIDEKHAESVVKAGGRLLTKQEVAQKELETEYDKASTLSKIAGAAVGAGPLPPQLEAWHRGGAAGLTSGLGDVAAKGVLDTIVPGAGKAYVERGDKLKEGYEGTYGAGEVGGMVGGAAIGAASGAGGAGVVAKALPSAGIGALGGAVENLVGRGLAGVASRGAAGRAFTTAAKLGTRGLVEGALTSGAQAAADQVAHDKPIDPDKLFAAIGTGALYGAGGGALLGGAGSLAASGVRGIGASLRSRLSGLAVRAEEAATAAETAGVAPAKEVRLSPEALDAGLGERVAAESPIAFGAERKPIQIRGQGKIGVSPTEEAFDFSKPGFGLNPEAGIAERNTLGRFQGTVAAEDGLFASNNKRNITRDVVLKDGIDAAEASAARKPIAIPQPDVAPTTPTSLVNDLTTVGGTKGLAYDRAWSSLGGGFGLQSTEFTKRAQRYLPNKTRDVGEWLMRKGVINAESGILDLAKGGTPEKMLPAIRAAVEADGVRLGQITGASGGRVQSSAVMNAIDDVAKTYEASAATRPIGRSIRNFGNELLDSLGVNKGAESHAVQDVLRERKALDLMVFENAALDPSITTQVKRELRGKLEGLVVDSLDESSGRLSGELAKEYKALKKDYLAGMIAQDAAEDSAARAAKAGFLGLKDLTLGNGSLVKSMGSKLFRERGDAVAAAMLFREAERGGLARWVQKVDDQIGRASKGLLQAPVKGALRPADTMPAPKLLARTALQRAAEFKSDPDGFVEKATRQAESIAAHDPGLASALVAKQVQAMAFLAEKVPVTPDPDPLDPHPAPKMTPNEQAELARYAWYVDKPQRFFSEVARGKLTFEGAEVAQRLMPTAFEDLQMQTMDALATQMARGNKLPFRQRQLIGVLMDMATTPSQRPDHAKFLQANLEPLADQPAPKPSGGGGGGKSLAGPKLSALDRLEAGGIGHR